LSGAEGEGARKPAEDDGEEGPTSPNNLYAEKDVEILKRLSCV
jgi:hypothetical protein